jgi:hypothetical protein
MYVYFLVSWLLAIFEKDCGALRCSGRNSKKIGQNPFSGMQHSGPWCVIFSSRELCTKCDSSRMLLIGSSWGSFMWHYCWIPIPTNLAPSLVASSLMCMQQITNQLSVNLDFIKRVNRLFHRLTIAVQLVACLPITRLLELRTPVTFLSLGVFVQAGPWESEASCWSHCYISTHSWIPVVGPPLEFAWSCLQD